MADVIFILISVFVCGFVVAFVVLALASAVYRIYILRKLNRKLYPCTQACEIATINENNLRQSEDVENSPTVSDEHKEQTTYTALEMSKTTIAPLPPVSDIQNVEIKSPNSARIFEGSQESKLTGAAEVEEQLMGVGHLPKDVQAQQELQDTLKKAIGPPSPILD